MAATGVTEDESLYPIAVLIDELRNEDVQVTRFFPVPAHPFSVQLTFTPDKYCDR